MDAPPFEHRGAVTDEWIALLITLWTEDDPTFEGRFYHVRDVGFFPKPVQKPYPPIQVGGNTRPSIRRAARYGQSWHALGVLAEDLPPLLGYLREQLRASGRAEGACGLSVRYGMRIIGPSGDATRRDLEEPGRVFVGTAAQVWNDSC